jgi:hypothetical protein
MAVHRATAAAAPYGYSVRFVGIGAPPPGSPPCGACTQAAIFTASDAVDVGTATDANVHAREPARASGTTSLHGTAVTPEGGHSPLPPLVAVTVGPPGAYDPDAGTAALAAALAGLAEADRAPPPAAATCYVPVADVAYPHRGDDGGAYVRASVFYLARMAVLSAWLKPQHEDEGEDGLAAAADPADVGGCVSWTALWAHPHLQQLCENDAACLEAALVGGTQGGNGHTTPAGMTIDVEARTVRLAPWLFRPTDTDDDRGPLDDDYDAAAAAAAAAAATALSPSEEWP